MNVMDSVKSLFLKTVLSCNMNDLHVKYGSENVRFAFRFEKPSLLVDIDNEISRLSEKNNKRAIAHYDLFYIRMK